MDDEGPGVADLVAAAAAGDAQAWNAIVERYAPLVMSVVRRYRMRSDDGLDVAQTVWLRLVEHLKDIREPRALPGWIVVTTSRECLRLLAGEQRTRPMDALQLAEQVSGVDDTPPDADLLHTERREALLAAFAELSDRQRALLLLLVKDPPPSYEEISVRLDMPLGSIGPTRARALQRLRRSAPIAALLDTTALDTAELTTPSLDNRVLDARSVAGDSVAVRSQGGAGRGVAAVG
jgi:RNA polymerase sigma factor (sigma-70 family)